MSLKLSVVFFCLLVFACKKSDAIDCDNTIVISDEQYMNGSDDQLTINDVEINGDCLKIKFSAGGCNGETWVTKLIASEAIIETSPPQRNIRLSLANEELCEAYLTQEITFNVQELQTNDNSVMLNITNADDHILYSY